jgi:uncharacterized protein YndB with AHSA1/START domain
VSGVALVVRRVIRAGAQPVFEAWTRPELLRSWWGPRPVTCSGAEVDLRVGGKYCILNALPDGGTITIEGEFEAVEPPHRLVYTWRMRPGEGDTTRVTVRFEHRGADETEVIVVHEQIGTDEVRRSHEGGWMGCLDGLERHFTVGLRS